MPTTVQQIESLLRTIRVDAADGQAGSAPEVLNPGQRAHLDVKKLADAAISSTPDEFNRTATHLVDQAKNDWDIGRAIEDRKRSEINTWHDQTTGMGHTRIRRRKPLKGSMCRRRSSVGCISWSHGAQRANRL